jgi:hypothetical protein
VHFVFVFPTVLVVFCSDLPKARENIRWLPYCVIPYVLDSE